MQEPTTSITTNREYPTGELVRRLLALAWRHRLDFILCVTLSLVLLVLGLVGLQLLGVTTPDPTIVPDGDGVISAPSAAVPVVVVHAREDLEIAREMRELVAR